MFVKEALRCYPWRREHEILVLFARDSIVRARPSNDWKKRKKNERSFRFLTKNIFIPSDTQKHLKKNKLKVIDLPR